MTAPARTVFLGTGAFAVPILDVLAACPDARLTAVITAPARPAGRGGALQVSPVGTWAEERGVMTLTPARLRDPATLDVVRGLAPELLVLADYGRLVPAALLDLPPDGALNLHPSLLPRHRGATPIPAAIEAGDAETGVTLMRMDEGLDTGPILAQRRVPLGRDETAPEVEARLAILAAHLLGEVLPAWLLGKIEARPQDPGSATLTRPLRRADGALDPRRPARELERRVRAYQPWPGSYLDTDAGRIVVWRARALGAPGAGTAPASAAPEGSVGSPGQLVAVDDGLALVTSDGWLHLLEVQPAGGTRMTGAALLRGRSGLIGSWVSAPA